MTPRRIWQYPLTGLAIALCATTAHGQIEDGAARDSILSAELNGRRTVLNAAAFVDDCDSEISDDDEIVTAVHPPIDLGHGVQLRLCRMSAAEFDSQLYAGESDAQGVESRLQKILRKKIREVVQVCGLTDAQRRKLELAGTGDIKRLTDRIAKSRDWICQGGAVESIGGCFPVSEAKNEIRTLRHQFSTNPFGYGSIYDKTLRRVLTSEELLKYKRWEVAH